METVIEVKHLKKYYGDLKAVDDISFQVEKGEIFGFLGVNGAGKSTTINTLCTLYSPMSGSVKFKQLILGQDDQKIRSQIGIVFQKNTLDSLLTVQENLFIRGSLYGNSKLMTQKRIANICNELKMTDILQKKYGELSGGQQRRCEIGAALIHAPQILFLDEPTTGLDPATRKDVWEVIERLRKERGITVFLTTHYMEEASISQHIAIIDHGKIKEFDTPFALKNQFAKDCLFLYPKTLQEREMCEELEKKEIPFTVNSNHITVEIEKTKNALAILNQIQNYMNGFEVIQGSMDDVFLSVIGEK